MYEEDEELLEDAIVENRQASEMAKIYTDILTGMMDAFASVISNNLNQVMKLLTSHHHHAVDPGHRVVVLRDERGAAVR